MLNLLHRARLPDRVYGPNLMLRLCERAAAEGLPVFLFGGTAELLEALRLRLAEKIPHLQFAGSRPSLFRRLSAGEEQDLAGEILSSGAAITFIGLGCPRQEVSAYELRRLLPMPLVAVGAAFNFHAGQLSQAPPAWQARGLEWLFRLLQEPRRPRCRYLLLNPLFVSLLALEAIGLGVIPTGTPPGEPIRYGLLAPRPARPNPP